MLSKRGQEGYLMIDNRHAPSITPEQAHATGKEIAGVGNNGLYETATVTCSHCHAQVILRPDRTRDRGYCRKCDHYICDQCEVVRIASGYACKPLNQLFDEIQAAAFRCDAPPAPARFIMPA